MIASFWVRTPPNGWLDISDVDSWFVLGVSILVWFLRLEISLVEFFSLCFERIVQRGCVALA